MLLSVPRFSYHPLIMLLIVPHWPLQTDWYYMAEQPAPAPHPARPEGRAALTHLGFADQPNDVCGTMNNILS